MMSPSIYLYCNGAWEIIEGMSVINPIQPTSPMVTNAQLLVDKTWYICGLVARYKKPTVTVTNQ